MGSNPIPGAKYLRAQNLSHGTADAFSGFLLRLDSMLSGRL
jgi:hypothetical protein